MTPRAYLKKVLAQRASGIAARHLHRGKPAAHGLSFSAKRLNQEVYKHPDLA
jgi:hypothetical protein